jgi:hypothetical protein
MCNLYSITTNQAAIGALFRVVNRYVGNLAPMPRRVSRLSDPDGTAQGGIPPSFPQTAPLHAAIGNPPGFVEYGDTGTSLHRYFRGGHR